MIPNKCLSIRRIYTGENMFPVVASIYPSGWIMGMGHKAVPKERICSPALICWAFDSEKYTYRLSAQATSSASSRFCSFQWEERKAVFLDTKHFLSGTCKSDPTHLPKRLTPRPVRLPKTETLFGQQLLRDKIPTLTMATEGFYVGQQMLPPKRSSPSMGKEWVPPGENVETFPYVLFGWQEGAAVFTIKLHLQRVLISLRRIGTIWSAKTYHVGKKHQKRKAKATAKTQWGAWVTFVFLYLCWITSFCPLQTHSPPISHPTLCPGKLRFRDSSDTLPRPLASTKGRHQQVIRGWEENDIG